MDGWDLGAGFRVIGSIGLILVMIITHYCGRSDRTSTGNVEYVLSISRILPLSPYGEGGVNCHFDVYLYL